MTHDNEFDNIPDTIPDTPSALESVRKQFNQDEAIAEERLAIVQFLASNVPYMDPITANLLHKIRTGEYATSTNP